MANAQEASAVARPITSGSRQAPDPFDQFLEKHYLYRKHTARDASSLFRVVAEQMYDTQMLHYEVRLECVRFMTVKRHVFEKYVQGDFDTYIMDMSKPRTFGTMLELRAMCCMYHRNIMLFEPFNLGTAVTFNERYRNNFCVFFANENHFDSVFTLDYIKAAAICQALSFKLLYKKVFKLPDVNYATEIMLHPQTFQWGKYEVELDDNGFISKLHCQDGRIFNMDLPLNTKCILENYKLCNYHNYEEPKMPISDKHNDPRRNIEQNNGANNITPVVKMCPNRTASCVRQLLDDGITPFPYKVAKSLDAHMYRNIEFDCWNDLRKEAKRYNTYAGDYDFKVGAKCYVDIVYQNERDIHTCHVQNISYDKTQCVVYVEDFGEKLVVPFDALHPLPPNEFQPWPLPFRQQRQAQRLTSRAKYLKWRKSKFYNMQNYYQLNPSEVYVQFGNLIPPNNQSSYDDGYEPINFNEQQQQEDLLESEHEEEVVSDDQQSLEDLSRDIVVPGKEEGHTEERQVNENIPAAESSHQFLSRGQRSRHTTFRNKRQVQRTVPDLQSFGRQAGNRTGAKPRQPRVSYVDYAQGSMPRTRPHFPALSGGSTTMPRPWQSVPMADECRNMYSQMPATQQQPLPAIPTQPNIAAPAPGSFTDHMSNNCMLVPYSFPPMMPPPGHPMGALPYTAPVTSPSFVPMSPMICAPTMSPAQAPYGGILLTPPTPTSPIAAHNPILPTAASAIVSAGLPNEMQPTDARCNAVEKRRESSATTASSNISAEVRPSLHVNGEDLPSDMNTLRYFYNIGVSTHNRKAKLEHVNISVQSNDINEGVKEFANELTAAQQPAQELREYKRNDNYNAHDFGAYNYEYKEQNHHNHATYDSSSDGEGDNPVCTPSPALETLGKHEMQGAIPKTAGQKMNNKAVAMFNKQRMNNNYNNNSSKHQQYNNSRLRARCRDSADETDYKNYNNNNHNNNNNNSNHKNNNVNNNNYKINNNNHNKNNNMNNNKANNKGLNRKLAFNLKDNVMQHATLLPTPTPSPINSGKHFAFYPTTPTSIPPPSPMLQQQPAPHASMYFPPNGGAALPANTGIPPPQSPYAWGMTAGAAGAPPPSLSVVGGMPYEVLGNGYQPPPLPGAGHPALVDTHKVGLVRGSPRAQPVQSSGQAYAGVH